MISRAIRWQDIWRLAKDFTSGLGVLVILTAIADFFFADYTKDFNTPLSLYAALVACLLYALVKNWPRSSFVYKIANRDVRIELRIGDISKYKGSIVVPVNTAFDVNLNGNVGVAKSVKATIIKKYFKKDHTQVAKRIQKELKRDLYLTQHEGDKYKIGTTVQIKADRRPDAPFYFLANSHRTTDGSRVKAHEDDLTLTLSSLWSYVSEHGAKGDIAIPLIGTGHGRLSITREEVYKEIVRSFVASCAGKVYCDKLTIFIRPSDIDSCKIAVQDMIDFTRYQAQYVDFSPLQSVRTGSPANE